MPKPGREMVGSVVALWRYPVKSMLGEELGSARVTERGLIGDRAYGLVDESTGKVASAKNPRKWERLFEFRASFPEPSKNPRDIAPVRITFPDGTVSSSDQPEIDGRLSQALGARVRLMGASLEEPDYEEYWPDIEGLPHREQVTNETMPARTFFDGAVLHLLTTASLARLHELYPEGRFEVRRFRPNLVIGPSPERKGFVENDWIDRTVGIGDAVRVRITGAAGRCVMTTLPQGGLPRDLGILRTIARHNRVKVGVYASVEHGGDIRPGDPVWLE